MLHKTDVIVFQVMLITADETLVRCEKLNTCLSVITVFNGRLSARLTLGISNTFPLNDSR